MTTARTTDQAIAKAIVASQLTSVPLTCAMTCLLVILTWRYFSKTSVRRFPNLGYFEHPYGSTRPSELKLTRAAAGVAASLCALLNCLELWHVYQAAVVHPEDLLYFQKTPWTFALIPILTAMVTATCQVYFSEKACRDLLDLRLMTVLGLLGVVNFVGGMSSSIAMVVRLSQGSQSNGTAATERLFWIYITTATISSFLISFRLVDCFLKQRLRVKIKSSQNPAIKCEPITITGAISLLLSSYTLVFLLQFSCFVSACASLSGNFNSALHASQAFFVLQRATICLMSLSLLHALLKDSADLSRADSKFQVRFDKIDNSSVENGLREECKEEAVPHRPKRPSEVEVQDVGRFIFLTYNHPADQALSSSSEADVEELFLEAFPTDAITPVTTEKYPKQNNLWPITSTVQATLSLPEKALGEFTLLPGQRSSLLVRKKQQTLSPMRDLHLLSDKLRSSPTSNPKAKKAHSKSKKRKSQLKYTISSPIEQYTEGNSLESCEDSRFIGFENQTF